MPEKRRHPVIFAFSRVRYPGGRGGGGLFPPPNKCILDCNIFPFFFPRQEGRVSHFEEIVSLGEETKNVKRFVLGSIFFKRKSLKH